MDQIQILYKSGRVDKMAHSHFITGLDATNLNEVHKIYWTGGKTTFIPKFGRDLTCLHLRILE